MKEEIQSKIMEQIGDVAEMTKEGIMKAVEVMQEQCPLLVDELLRWEFAISLIIMSSFVAVGLLIALVAARLWKWARERESIVRCADGDSYIFPIIFSIISPIAICVGVTTNLTWLKIWIAPRLFLLEYISELVK